jgi:hypothetical protein
VFQGPRADARVRVTTCRTAEFTLRIHRHHCRHVAITVRHHPRRASASLPPRQAELEPRLLQLTSSACMRSALRATTLPIWRAGSICTTSIHRPDRWVIMREAAAEIQDLVTFPIPTSLKHGDQYLVQSTLRGWRVSSSRTWSQSTPPPRDQLRRRLCHPHP